MCPRASGLCCEAGKRQMVNSHEIEKRAQQKLCSSGYADVKDVICQYDERGHALRLYGRVSCFYRKQIAQELVRHIDLVDRVVNAIEVVDA